MKAIAALALFALLAACGPMSLREAERQCFERARLAGVAVDAVVAGTHRSSPMTPGGLRTSSIHLTEQQVAEGAGPVRRPPDAVRRPLPPCRVISSF